MGDTDAYGMKDSTDERFGCIRYQDGWFHLVACSNQYYSRAFEQEALEPFSPWGEEFCQQRRCATVVPGRDGEAKPVPKTVAAMGLPCSRPGR